MNRMRMNFTKWLEIKMNLQHFYSGVIAPLQMGLKLEWAPSMNLQTMAIHRNRYRRLGLLLLLTLVVSAGSVTRVQAWRWDEEEEFHAA